MRKLIPTTEAAKLLSVHPSTLKLWEDNGTLLPAFKTAGGHRRYRLADIERLRSPIVRPRTEDPWAELKACKTLADCEAFRRKWIGAKGVLRTTLNNVSAKWEARVKEIRNNNNG
jgi:DNA-binding transcriptional MerR regulator